MHARPLSRPAATTLRLEEIVADPDLVSTLPEETLVPLLAAVAAQQAALSAVQGLLAARILERSPSRADQHEPERLLTAGGCAIVGCDTSMGPAPRSATAVRTTTIRARDPLFGIRAEKMDGPSARRRGVSPLTLLYPRGSLVTTMMEVFPGITMDPDVRFGKPCIAGTRIDVATIMGLFAAGETVDTVVAEYALTP